MRRKEKQRVPLPLRLLTVILAAAAVILFIAASVEIRSTATSYNEEYDVSDYMFAIHYYDGYGELYDRLTRDQYRDTTYTKEVSEYRDLARYYELSLLYNAYNTTGDTRKAKAFDEKRSGIEPGLGSLADKAESARRMAGG